MNASVVVAVVLVAYLLAYRFYSLFLSRRVFGLMPDEPVPSREQEDGVDYVPTKLHVLWGHHYTSIAGAAPSARTHTRTPTASTAATPTTRAIMVPPPPPRESIRRASGST